MESITIDYNAWKAGISTADGVEDGGYSPKYGGHNLQEERDGTLYPQHAYDTTEWGSPGDLATNGGEPVIYVKVSTYGLGGTGQIFGILVDDLNNPYAHDSVNRLTDKGGLSTTNIVFGRKGLESGAAFKGDVYIAGDDDIVLVDISNTGAYVSSNSNWWSNTRAHAKLSGDKVVTVVVEDTIYFIEQNAIHIWDGTTSQEDALLLPPDFYATAGIKHPNGRDLIVFGTVKESGNEVAGAGFRAYIINLVDLEFTDEIQLNSEVQGVWNVTGTIYVTTNEWLAIFNGTSIDPVYHLGINLGDSPATDIRESLIWTQHGTVTDQGYLLIPDGSKLLAVGNIGGGTILWHVADLSANADVVHMAFNIGNKYVGVYAYSGARWSGTLVQTIIKLDDHDGAAKWAANKIRFNQKAWVRKIVINHETLASGDDLKLHHIREDGTEQELRQITYTKYGAVSETRVDVNIRTDVFQPMIQWIAGGVGIKKITIFYENAE